MISPSVFAALANIEADIKALSDLLNVPTLTIYTQRDPKWAGLFLGSGPTTIGISGCLETSIASILTDAGKSFDPATMNEWLRTNGGYTGGTQFVFDSVNRLGVVRYDHLVDCPNAPAPIATLDAWINSGNYAIVKVDNSLPPDFHWVRYLGNGQMVDPWYGDVAPIVPRYHGANAAECILRAVFYKRVSA